MENVFLAFVGVSIVVLLYLSAWFSRAETALSLTTSAQIASMSEAGVDVSCLVSIKKDLDRAIVAILIGNNVVNVLLSTLTALVANSLFRVWGVTVAVGALTFVLVVFGEITPKSHAVKANEKVALKNACPLYTMVRILGPLITLFLKLSENILKFAGNKVEKRHMLFSDRMIMDLATLGEQEGIIKPIEKDIIHNVFSFGDLKIGEIMLPLEKVVTLTVDTDINAAKMAIVKHCYTRVPVKESEGKIVGVLYTKDIIHAHKGSVGKWMRKPFFVSSSSDITKIFEEMKKYRIHIGIVLDDNEQFVGIVTLEDIIEELVGSIRDEFYERHK